MLHLSLIFINDQWVREEIAMKNWKFLATNANDNTAQYKTMRNSKRSPEGSLQLVHVAEVVQQTGGRIM